MKSKTDYNVEKAARCERVAFRKMESLHNCFKGYERIYLPETGKDVYDILLYKVKDGMMYNRIFIEIKIRYANYDSEGYVLETKKYNSIVKLAEQECGLKPDEYKIFYINYTPSGTYIWNTDIIKDLDVKTDNMNKVTCKSRFEKTSKTNWHLPIDKAIRHYDYVFNEGDVIQEAREVKINEVLRKEPEKVDWLYKILFDKDE